MKLEQDFKKEKQIEIMETPEIVVQKEKGAQLFSLLLKAENSDWGETETTLATEMADYFKDNPLSSEVVGAIRNFHEQEIDEETLYNLALTYQHPERAVSVLKMAEKYKPHVKNPQEVHQKLLEILETFDQDFSTSKLAEKFNIEIEKDKEKRIMTLGKTRERIENLINFFKPSKDTSDIKKLSFVPTDPLYKKNSGRAFSAFPEEHIIISHIDNIDNQDHEFCHGIINPIVEKLSQQLTDEQKEGVSKLASEKLKQDYGEGHFSLLCEEFIRTYNDVLKKGEMPQTYEDFTKKVSEISKDQFQKGLSESSGFRQRCEDLEITTIEDLREKSLEYFEKFEKNQLRNIIFNLYKEYSNRKDKKAENFEQFILNNFPKKI